MAIDQLEAAHEAGHAVFALLDGLSFQEIQLNAPSLGVVFADSAALKSARILVAGAAGEVLWHIARGRIDQFVEAGGNVCVRMWERSYLVGSDDDVKSDRFRLNQIKSEDEIERDAHHGPRELLEVAMTFASTPRLIAAHTLIMSRLSEMACMSFGEAKSLFESAQASASSIETANILRSLCAVDHESVWDEIET